MNGVASECFAVAVMLGGAWAFTRWIGWILDSVDEAIDETFGDIVELPTEAKATVDHQRAWGGELGAGADRSGSHSHNPLIAPRERQK